MLVKRMVEFILSKKSPTAEMRGLNEHQISPAKYACAKTRIDSRSAYKATGTFCVKSISVLGPFGLVQPS